MGFNSASVSGVLLSLGVIILPLSKPNCSCLFYNLKDKKLKEQEKKGEILHRQLPKKTEKSPVSYRQPSSCLISQIQNTKAVLKDRKVTKAGGPEKGQWEKYQWCVPVRMCMCGHAQY